MNYLYSNGTIVQLGSSTQPSAPQGYNTWSASLNFATTPPFITNVAPSSKFAGVHYISPTAGDPWVRVFYQTTNGDIRSIYNGPAGATWLLDNTTIANVPIGSPLSALVAIQGTAVCRFAYFPSPNGPKYEVLSASGHSALYRREWSLDAALNVYRCGQLDSPYHN